MGWWYGANEKTIAKHMKKEKNEIVLREQTLNKILDNTKRPPTKESEEDLSRALIDPKLTREQKDRRVSMYLWGRGMESASFIADIMASKGQHTKETRAFKSQIRFDFEIFMDTFCTYLEGQARIISKIYDIDVMQERADYITWVKERDDLARKDSKEKKQDYKPQSYTYADYLKSLSFGSNKTDIKNAAIIMLAMHAMDEAELIRKRIENVAKARMREKGHGIYVSTDGKPYSFDDPEVDDIIKADRERASEIEKDNG